MQFYIFLIFTFSTRIMNKALKIFHVVIPYYINSTIYMISLYWINLIFKFKKFIH